VVECVRVGGMAREGVGKGQVPGRAKPPLRSMYLLFRLCKLTTYVATGQLFNLVINPTAK